MDPDSVYNVISYFTGWPGFDPNLGSHQNPSGLNTVTTVLFVVCCAGVAWLALAAPRGRGWPSCASCWWPRSC